jgi:multisubunit Na+/H+ antiporter MnhB subunit
MATLSLSPRTLRLVRALVFLTALMLLVGCAEGSNPLTDTAAQDTALDGLRSLRFWLWVVTGVAVVVFVMSYVSQTWLPEWFQSHRMSIRVGALVVGAGLAAFNWIVGQAEAARGAGGVVLVPLAQHALQLAQALPHLLR